MEEKQTQQTPVQVIKSIIASNKIMFVTIVMSIVALFTVIDLFVNKPDLGGMAFFGMSVGDLFGEEVVAILDTISTIIFVFSIIGALPTIAKAVGFWLIRQGVKDDYASQKKMHVGFLLIKIPLYYAAVLSALYGLGVIIIGVIIGISSGVVILMFLGLLFSMYFLLITKYQMGLVELLAGATNTMRTGINMVEKRTLVTVLMWISAIFAFLGMFGGGFTGLLISLCNGLYLIFIVTSFSNFDKAYGYIKKPEMVELKKAFKTDPSMRAVALTLGYTENPANPNELTLTFSGYFKVLFGTRLMDGSAPRTAVKRPVPVRQQQVQRPVYQKQTYAPTRPVNYNAPIATTAIDNDQKLAVHLLSIFTDDIESFDQRFNSLGKKVYRGDIECPIKPVCSQVFKDTVTEKSILRIEFINKINSAIKKIKYDVIPCVNDGSALGVIEGVEVAFDSAIENDQKACAKYGLVIPDGASNGRVKVTFVEFSDGLFWDKGSNDFYFTTEEKTDYDMNLYLSING
ncbi:MAG: hypothetical protein J6C62_08000 [Clostridia bacterium]|nr:hypothetical protein [Clostridia bacterium]